MRSGGFRILFLDQFDFARHNRNFAGRLNTDAHLRAAYRKNMDFNIAMYQNGFSLPARHYEHQATSSGSRSCRGSRKGYWCEYDVSVATAWTAILFLRFTTTGAKRLAVVAQCGCIVRIARHNTSVPIAGWRTVGNCSSAKSSSDTASR